jgi:hypothetical protein
MLVVTPTGLKEINRADFHSDRAYYLFLLKLLGV